MDSSLPQVLCECGQSLVLFLSSFSVGVSGAEFLLGGGKTHLRWMCAYEMVFQHC